MNTKQLKKFLTIGIVASGIISSGINIKAATHSEVENALKYYRTELEQYAFNANNVDNIKETLLKELNMKIEEAKQNVKHYNGYSYYDVDTTLKISSYSNIKSAIISNNYSDEQLKYLNIGIRRDLSTEMLNEDIINNIEQALFKSIDLMNRESIPMPKERTLIYLSPYATGNFHGYTASLSNYNNGVSQKTYEVVICPKSNDDKTTIDNMVETIIHEFGHVNAYMHKESYASTFFKDYLKLYQVYNNEIIDPDMANRVNVDWEESISEDYAEEFKLHYVNKLGIQSKKETKYDNLKAFDEFNNFVHKGYFGPIAPIITKEVFEPVKPIQIVKPDGTVIDLENNEVEKPENIQVPIPDIKESDKNNTNVIVDPGLVNPIPTKPIEIKPITKPTQEHSRPINNSNIKKPSTRPIAKPVNTQSSLNKISNDRFNNMQNNIWNKR